MLAAGQMAVAESIGRNDNPSKLVRASAFFPPRVASGCLDDDRRLDPQPKLGFRRLEKHR
jgi:hypothetical protein